MKQRRITGLTLLAAVALGVTMVGPSLATVGAAAGTAIWDLTFDDATTGVWVPNGNPVLSYVADPADATNQVLQVGDRANSWDGISSPTGVLQPGATYDVSMNVRLAAGTTGPANIHWVLNNDGAANQYAWVTASASSAVTDAAWTALEASFTVPADATAAGTKIYIGAEDITGVTSYTFLVDDLVVTQTGGGTPPPPPPAEGSITTGFEDGLGSWYGRSGSNAGAPTVAATTDYAAAGQQSACVTNRLSEGDGLAVDPSGILTEGATYSITADLRFVPDGTATAGAIWLSYYDGVSYGQLNQTWTTVSNSGFTAVSASITIPANTQFIYFETPYQKGDLAGFCVDNVVIAPPEGTPDLTLTPLKDTVGFPLGAAVGGPQIQGQKADLLLHHFNQVTSENAMKVVSWYDASGNFIGANNTLAMATMQFARAGGLRVYGHNLAWFENTPGQGNDKGMPAWWFNVSPTDSTPLTNSPADQAILRGRLEDHIKNVAKTLADEFGLFGSSTNPLVAFDAVNEPIAEAAGVNAYDLRESQWYKILGPDWVELPFIYAEKYFNTSPAGGGYADPSADRPVKLFLNDFNFELDSSRTQRTINVVNRLVADGVPVDGIGDQSHLAPGGATSAARVRAEMDKLAQVKDKWGNPIQVAITELDEAICQSAPCNPTEAQLTNQGWEYRNLMNEFRDFNAVNPGQLFSVTLWGLDDSTWWRYSSQGPAMPFDGNLQARVSPLADGTAWQAGDPGSTWVYCGMIGADHCTLPGRQMTANVFGTDATTGDISATPAGVGSAEWSKLPSVQIGSGAASFLARWAPDALTVYVAVTDPTVDATDAVTLALAGGTYVVNRDGTVTGGIPAAVVPTATGYALVATLPLTDAQAGDKVMMDVSVNTTGSPDGWNSPGSLGTLTLWEPLSFVAVPAATGPVSVGTCDTVDPVWSSAATVTTGKVDPLNTKPGVDPSEAQVKLLWADDTLYVLADVTDPVIDTSSSMGYQDDSLEIFLDRGNTRSGGYVDGTTQMRIGADGFVDPGSGDPAWLQASVCLTPTGFRVVAAVDLAGYGGAGTFQGVDFQVNDAQGGARVGATNWADQTGNGWQSNLHWGVAELMAAEAPLPTVGPDVRPRGDTGGSVVLPKSGISMGGALALALVLAGAFCVAMGLRYFRKIR
ncbi:MAG: endo-1,4-beta-xylanase [Propionibacteriaceae bacterium]|jgi:endo-1,4-beta-xylanase|nr:endo-1,4-beta-xylanase [Propionibacteriaceae bacterium]